MNKGKNACNNRSLRGDLLDVEVIEKVESMILTTRVLMTRLLLVWCRRGDLNPHGDRPPPPQDGVSTNSTTSASNSWSKAKAKTKV